MLTKRLFSWNATNCNLPCGLTCYGDPKADTVRVDAAALGLLIGMEPSSPVPRPSRRGKDNYGISRSPHELSFEYSQACRRAEMERWEDDQKHVAELRARWQLERQDGERRQAEEWDYKNGIYPTLTADQEADRKRRIVVEIRGEIWRIFKEHSPSRLQEVVSLFEKYEDLERELYMRICTKYGVDPKMSLMPLEQEMEEDIGFSEQCPDEVFEAEQRRVEAFQHERARIEQAAANRMAVSDFLACNGFKDINIKRKRLLKSYYALHVAVKQNDADLVRLLLGARADATLTNSAAQTPLQLAQRLNKQNPGAFGDLMCALENYEEQKQQTLVTHW